jgi:hypothetical protein
LLYCELFEAKRTRKVLIEHSTLTNTMANEVCYVHDSNVLIRWKI